MEQNRLGVHNMFHHEHQSMHDQSFKSTNTLRPAKISLRSMSKSDPHLNIPHLMMAQDEEHPSLNKIVSGLFHPETAFCTVPHLHIENPHEMSHNKSGFHVSESSANILSEQSLTAPAIRKSSSAVDWSHITDKSQEVSPWSTPDNTLKSNTTAFLPGLAQRSDHSQGGLVMSSVPENKMSVLVPSASTQNPFSQSLASAASSSNAVNVNPLEPQVTVDRKSSLGMFGNVFRSGFFSRPVIRSDEEQYRYIMALDR